MPSYDDTPAPGEASSRTPVREEKPTAPPPANLPAGWALMDDKLFGTQVAVPAGWTPRMRGDITLSVEPDDVPKAGAFFVPLRLRGSARPDELADGFDGMLRKALPGLRTQTTGKPTPESVQRDLRAEIGGTPVAGGYRAVVGRFHTGFVMGYLAPTSQVERLRPTFYRILGSYRYTGPRMRLQPFKSAAVELRIPPGWQVRTSEGDGTADQDIDWEVLAPQAPGVRAFMVSPKYFTSNWISDVMTGQVDPQMLAWWRNRGYEMANIGSDAQAIQMAMAAALPGLQVVRQQSLDEVRDIFAKAMQIVAQSAQSGGGRFTIHVHEFQGRRMVGGVEMRSVVTLGMGALVVPAAMKGNCGLWMTGIRGFEAPADRFAQFAPTLDRVANSFSYTLWWIRQVQKANEEQARILRRFYADMNRIDREIWDSHVQTRSAIAEMMYDTLTENYGYANEKTGSIEKIPADQLEKFRNSRGEIVSPEDVIDRNIPVNDATPVREAFSDDYMAFDRHVQVWP